MAPRSSTLDTPLERPRASSSVLGARTGSSEQRTASERHAAIDRVISGVDARVRHQHRIRVHPGERIEAPTGTVTIVYVIEGSLTLQARPQLARAGSQPHRAGSQAHFIAGQTPPPGSSASFTHSELQAGDALLCSGIEARTLEATAPSLVLRSSFDTPSSAAPIWAKIPSALTVRDLPSHEPSVAALASTMGYTLGGDEGACAHEERNQVVCRMMANTLLAALIRAWALRGCSPEGWPAAANDPFLDRVVEAVRADPARNWTLAELARVGTMSRSSFAKRFRDQLGTTPANYVTQVRIESAQDLLARGCSVTEVSRSIGYESDDGFRRAFTRNTGLNPSAWKAQAV